jgi:nucleotide-binding universal stress UspA family protein
MNKRFIVLIDFSAYSANLLKYAYDWSRQINADLLLLHKSEKVISARLAEEKRDEIVRRIYSDQNEALRDFALSVIGEPSPNVSFKVTHSIHLSDSISELLDEPYRNLVFAGMKGTGLMQQLFIGSVAIEVIEQTESIVVAIPREVDSPSFTRLMVGVKAEFPLNTRALDDLLGFWGGQTPSIHFFTVVPDQEETSAIEDHLRALASLFAEKTSTSFSVYRADNVFEEVRKLMHQDPRQILVAQKGSRLLKDHLLRQLFINKLIYEGKTPLIALP